MIKKRSFNENTTFEAKTLITCPVGKFIADEEA